MKYFASILQRPMALIFLLLFGGGCLILLYTINTKNDSLTRNEPVEYDAGSIDNKNGPAIDSDEDDFALSDLAIGGPDESDLYAPELGDSGEEDAVFVVVSEVVDDPSLCTEFEKYDQVRQTCYFTCETEVSCDQIEANVNASLSKIESIYDNFAGSYSEAHSEQEKLKTLATYSVDEGEWLEKKTGNDLEKYKEIWAIFATIAPDEISDAHVKKYTVYENKKSDTAAFVELIDDQQAQWELAVNIHATDEQSRTENIFLLTHEFAHILTLNKDQIDIEAEESICQGYFTDEGCATESSYLGMFFKEFWSQADVLALKDSPVDAPNILFTQTPENFINQYAATNPGEDIAESFASFVFKAKPTAQDSGALTIAQQKINFFYKFPELIKMRADIRGDLNLERKFERR